MHVLDGNAAAPGRSDGNLTLTHVDASLGVGRAAGLGPWGPLSAAAERRGPPGSGEIGL